MELLNQSEDDFGITDVDDDSSDGEDDEDNDEDDDNEEDDDYEEVTKIYFNCFKYQKQYLMYLLHYLCVSLQEWVAVLDDGEDSDESPGDWAKLETMRSSHPIYFAKKLAEVLNQFIWKIITDMDFLFKVLYLDY